MGVISFLYLVLLPVSLALLCEGNTCHPLIPSPSLDRWDNILLRASFSWMVPTTLWNGGRQGKTLYRIRRPSRLAGTQYSRPPELWV